jgi:hypothetical protein
VDYLRHRHPLLFSLLSSLEAFHQLTLLEMIFEDAKIEYIIVRSVTNLAGMKAHNQNTQMERVPPEKPTTP